MVYALLRVPVRSGVAAVLSSCRPCFMRPAHLLACTRPRSATFFILVLRPVSRFTLPAFACLLTFKSISHFRLFVKWEFRSFRFWLESKYRRSLDVSDYSTFEAVCQELFSWPENFVLSGRSSLLHRAAMPCPYWFRLCAPLTDVSVRPVTQSVTNSILTASRPCYAVSGVYVQSMPFGVPLSRRRFIDCLYDTIRRAICQQVFFAFLAPLGFRIRCSPLFRTFRRRILCLISVFSAFPAL